MRSHIRAVQSPAGSVRLREARAFINVFPPGVEVLLLGASRGAVDDLARSIAIEKGATYGLHRLSFTQLAARLAALQLASSDRTPATTLGHEAVATRATFEAAKDEALEYFSPVARTPGFAKALARTLMELRLAGVAAGRLHEAARSGPDLAELMNRVELLTHDAGASDRAALFETATKALGSGDAGWPRMPVLLLDVPFDSEGEARFLGALEHALERAGIAGYFDRGTRRPHPAGRAFLALVACAAENFSAKRFAEYLSLAQIPASPKREAQRRADPEGPGRMRAGDDATWVASGDEVFGVVSEQTETEDETDA